MKRKIVFLVAVWAAMSSVFISCQESYENETNPAHDALHAQELSESDEIENKDESEISSIETIVDFLNMTYSEIAANEKTMTLSHYEGGGSPVFKMEDYEGIYLVFPCVSDNASMNLKSEELIGKLPVKLLIQSSEFEVCFGLKVGQTAEEVKSLSILWEDIYMSSENSLYYTSCRNDSNKVTVAWSIPEDMFSEWVASLSDEDDYYAKFFELIQPFKNEPVGTVVEVTVEKIE